MRFLKDPKKIPVVYKEEYADPNVSVLGGVVTYTPDIERLSEVLNAAVKQVDQLIVVDNGSKNFKEILALVDEINKKQDCKVTDVFEEVPAGVNKSHVKHETTKPATKMSKIFILKYPKNRGIAQALYDIMEFAIDANYDWVLTLDDDSVPQPELVKTYKKFTVMPKLGTMTCLMEDRNYDRREARLDKKFEYTYQSITSGCMMNVEAYKKSDKYQPDLFIDRVDHDIVYNLTKHGFKHIKINYVGLLHEMGRGDEKQILWYTARADNYNQLRNYYIFRNEYIMRKKYPEFIRIEWLQSGRPMWVNFVCLATKTLLYEDKKKQKIKAMLAGWRDGKKYIKKKHAQK